MGTTNKAGNTPVQAAALPAPEAITTAPDLGVLLSFLCDVAQPGVNEARAKWFSNAAPTLADCIGSQAAHLCDILAERPPLPEAQHAPTFYLLGNVFSLLAGLANVGAEMTHTHQRLKAEREGGAA